MSSALVLLAVLSASDAGTSVEDRAVSTLLSRTASWSARSESSQALQGARLSDRQLQRLLKALHEGVETPSALSPGADCPSTRAAGERCSVVIEDCMPKLGFILDALAYSTNRLDAAEADLHRVLDANVPHLRALALTALAKTGSPRVEPEARADLSDGSFDCYTRAPRLLLQLPKLSEASKEALRRTLFSGHWVARGYVAQALGASAEAWAVEALTTALSMPNERVQAAAAGALARRRDRSAAVEQALKRIASCHWSKRVRRAAAGPLSSAGALAASECALAKLPDGWQSNERRLPFTASVSKACAEAAGKASAVPLGEVGTTCIAGVDAGEWGGRLVLVERGVARVLVQDSFLNPRAVVVLNKDVWVLSGVDHLGSTGRLVRISADGGQTWSYEVLADLPASPIAFAIVDGKLVVSVRESDDITPCEKVASPPRELRFAVSVMEGAVTRVADPQPHCAP